MVSTLKARLVNKAGSRKPTSQESFLLKQYVNAQADGDPGLTKHDMLKVCQAIIGSTQFQFLD
ncbi:hypothetical protein Pla100_27810 [Neorhodopirellula pilleata]|uniref:Uncharacterized protein n=1 Tax=Neorhodopirellula pilleata TaxID=2714738 RepID=A0A5C6A8L3_9BACT|nr:hypothetical protein Pla100_27810 [Neorhodopirellula pilleata]